MSLIGDDAAAPKKKDSNPLLSLPTPSRRRGGVAARSDKVTIIPQSASSKALQKELASAGPMPWELPCTDAVTGGESPTDGQSQKPSYRDQLKARGQQALQRSQDSGPSQRASISGAPAQTVPQRQVQTNSLSLSTMSSTQELATAAVTAPSPLSVGIAPHMFSEPPAAAFPTCQMPPQQMLHMMAHTSSNQAATDATRQWPYEMKVPMPIQAPVNASADTMCYWQSESGTGAPPQRPATVTPSCVQTAGNEVTAQHVQQPQAAEARLSNFQSSPLMAIAMPQAMDNCLSNDQIAEILRTASTERYED